MIENHRRHSNITIPSSELNSELQLINEYAVANVVDQQVEKSKHELCMWDISYLPRVGYKGKEAENWLSKQTFELPNEVNTACIDEGILIAKLGYVDYLLLDTEPTRHTRIDDAQQNYQYYRASQTNIELIEIPKQDSHACMMISGEQSAACLAKLCAVDLRMNYFKPLNIAHTTIARVNAIVIASNHDIPRYFILVDSSYAQYLWDSILDAMQEYQGKVVPLSALIG